MAKVATPTGYSGKPLKDKLGLAEGMKVKLIHPPSDYALWIGMKTRSLESKSPPWNFVHLFTNSLSELEDQLFMLRSAIHPDGIIWVSWYKKSAGKPTEITEDLIRDTCLPMGLVDVKVCAVSDSWSGLKLVIRKELR